jgi:hypothetical protein
MVLGLSFLGLWSFVFEISDAKTKELITTHMAGKLDVGSSKGQQSCNTQDWPMQKLRQE